MLGLPMEIKVEGKLAAKITLNKFVKMERKFADYLIS